MKILPYILSFLIFCASPHFSMAQINDEAKHLVIPIGQEEVITIKSRFAPSLVSALVENCVVSVVSNGNQEYKLTIRRKDANFIGKGKACIQYTDGTPPKPRWITLEVDFVTSKITSNPDFVPYTEVKEIAVSPLQNDFTSGSGLTLKGLAHVDGGTASVVGNDIKFTPNENTDEGYIIYSASDASQSTSNGVIYFVKEKTLNSSQTQNFIIVNTGRRLFTLPNSNFTLTTGSTKGGVQILSPISFEYTPDQTKTGSDQFVFTDNLGNTITYQATLIQKQINTSSIKDDYVFTPKNTKVVFDVLANDLSSNFNIVSASPDLIQIEKGKYSYTPPAGFSGVKNFNYTINYGAYRHTGKIAVTVGNYEPLPIYKYEFNVLKNHPLALTYEVPISGYELKLLNNPHFGVAEIFDANTTATLDCNAVKSKSTLVYTPYNNYYGADSFDIQYCTPNNPCAVYKVYIKVHDHNNSVVCPCQGLDCVWAGDMNADGRVSVSDLLSLGRFVGMSGQTRQENLLPYDGGQTVPNWNFTQPNGKNIKHIDADGDGLITSQDMDKIIYQYGKVNTFVPEEVFPIKDYPFILVPQQTELDSGDLLVIDVIVGTPDRPVLDMNGLAFGVRFSPNMIAEGTLKAEFDKKSWLTSGESSLQMSVTPEKGLVHASVVKLGAVVVDIVDGVKPTSSSGYGKIGKLYAVVVDIVDGVRNQKNNDYVTHRINTEGIETEDGAGNKYKLEDTYLDIRVNRNKKEGVPSEEKLLVFPNPTSDVIQLYFNGNNIIKGYKIIDAMGQIIDVRNNLDRQFTTISTDNLNNGVYIIQVITTEGTITKKVTVARE